MAEQIDLTSADQVNAGTGFYKVQQIILERGESDGTGSYIQVLLEGSGGLKKVLRWQGSTARTLLLALNTTDLSSNSLEKRILQRAIAEGMLDGTVSGTPD